MTKEDDFLFATGWTSISIAKRHRRTMKAEALCGDAVTSRRGLLALLWSTVNVLAFFAFLIALIFAITAKNHNTYNDDDDNNAEEEEFNAEVAVTSRAMAFAALWTAVLASLMGLFGTVILGFQSPTGQYYTCCSSGVHRTTPLGLGSFIGSLIMFANLTLVCSVLFGEFEVSGCSVWIMMFCQVVMVHSTRCHSSCASYCM